MKRGKRTKKIIKLTLDGDFIMEYDSATQASKEDGYDVSSIIKCCKGKIKYHKGFIFKYKIDMQQI